MQLYLAHQAHAFHMKESMPTNSPVLFGKEIKDILENTYTVIKLNTFRKSPTYGKKNGHSQIDLPNIENETHIFFFK